MNNLNQAYIDGSLDTGLKENGYVELKEMTAEEIASDLYAYDPGFESLENEADLIPFIKVWQEKNK